MWIQCTQPRSCFHGPGNIVSGPWSPRCSAGVSVRNWIPSEAMCGRVPFVTWQWVMVNTYINICIYIWYIYIHKYISWCVYHVYYLYIYICIMNLYRYTTYALVTKMQRPTFGLFVLNGEWWHGLDYPSFCEVTGNLASFKWHPGNNQFRVAEKRANHETEDFDTFRTVFESSACDQFYCDKDMLLGSWKQFFFLKVVTCALRSAQHWAHFSVAIALASSNVHHSNLAPWWQRGDALCKQFQHIWITDTNGSRDLANLRLNFVRGVYSSFGWLARARMSSWRPLSHLATEDCAKTADFHRIGDPVGASWSRVSSVVVSWWCGECFGLSLALTYSAFLFSRNCCPLELLRFGKLWAELWPQFLVPLFFAEARTLQTRCMPDTLGSRAYLNTEHSISRYL
jgi:hypothetical protein